MFGKFWFPSANPEPRSLKVFAYHQQSTYFIEPVPLTLQLKLLSKDGLEDDVLPPPISERPIISWLIP